MTAIEADKLTKVYKLYDKPSARLKELFLKKNLHREFTALDSVSFGVKKGETLGIIGENGAGKSTLLKILAKTLHPSKGKLQINGTVSSLLELGSGFHPEFTGLDNIYFYGSLVGIDKNLMEKKKREIIDFSEIGDFINFPLKTYSSGMLVRLAFSVATAIDPDILIVDEALSVGDLHFQKKSTDRILSFKEAGKTIVFCSHELYHIARLCDRVLWLKNGKIHMEGKPLELIQEYETYQLGKNTELDRDITPEIDKDTDKQLADKTTDNLDDKKPKIIFIKNVQISPSQDMKSGNDLYIKIQMAASDDSIPYRIAVKLMTVNGLDIIGIGTNKLKPFYGSRSITLLFPKIQLRSGSFRIEAFVFDEEGVYWYDRKEALPVKIPRESIEIGIVNLPHEWIID
ncbi:MAG: polysaccharide ABC transporter ATP-binding protein [Candidatus Mariimomonas ferrooxydans]